MQQASCQVHKLDTTHIFEQGVYPLLSDRYVRTFPRLLSQCREVLS